MAGAIETSVKIAQFADVPLRERNVTTQHYGLIYNKTTKIYFTAVVRHLGVSFLTLMKKKT